MSSLLFLALLTLALFAYLIKLLYKFDVPEQLWVLLVFTLGDQLLSFFFAPAMAHVLEVVFHGQRIDGTLSTRVGGVGIKFEEGIFDFLLFVVILLFLDNNNSDVLIGDALVVISL